MHREYAYSNVLYLHQFATDGSNPACFISVCWLQSWSRQGLWGKGLFLILISLTLCGS